jgi:hypothetical protein
MEKSLSFCDVNVTGEKAENGQKKAIGQRKVTSTLEAQHASIGMSYGLIHNVQRHV